VGVDTPFADSCLLPPAMLLLPPPLLPATLLLPLLLHAF
jgi:hypothetical protein